MRLFYNFLLSLCPILVFKVMNKDLKKAINHFLEKEKPSKATLDRMALLAGFQNWDELHDTFMDGDEEK